jgi:hypothetical protein
MVNMQHSGIHLKYTVLYLIISNKTVWGDAQYLYKSIIKWE